jgi:uncharacterized protein
MLLIKKSLILIIRIYQKTISPWVPAKCIYAPTCSQYMINSIEKKGVIAGVIKGVFRILRCNQFFKGGIDEV